MSVATLAEVLQPALKGGYAVGGLVCLGWEDMRAYVAAAEAEGAPLILQAGPSCREHTPLPVLGVITKVRADQGFRAEVQRLLPEARNVVRVRALSERLDEADVVLPAMGLEGLLDATTEVIPEAVQRAFAAAQKATDHSG